MALGLSSISNFHSYRTAFHPLARAARPRLAATDLDACGQGFSALLFFFFGSWRRAGQRRSECRACVSLLRRRFCRHAFGAAPLQGQPPMATGPPAGPCRTYGRTDSSSNRKETQKKNTGTDTQPATTYMLSRSQRRCARACVCSGTARPLFSLCAAAPADLLATLPGSVCTARRDEADRQSEDVSKRRE
jgi:hypothetical protein